MAPTATAADKRPAQPKQASRKGKAAWRKNIDLLGVEASLENQRAAERVGLSAVGKDTAASSLFVEDRHGDEEERKRQQAKARPKAGKRPLKSLAILQSTSSVAPVQARARRGLDESLALNKPWSLQTSDSTGLTPEQRARRAGIKAKDIEKLRRAAGRDVRGAFGAIVEGSNEGKAGIKGPSAVIGDSYNVWDANDSSGPANKRAKGKGKANDIKTDEAWIEEAFRKDPRLPATMAEAGKKAAALALPLEGQSYNPAVAEYEALLSKALESAKSDEERMAREREFKRKWDEGAALAREMELGDDGRILGMAVDAAGKHMQKRKALGNEDEEESADEHEEHSVQRNDEEEALSGNDSDDAATNAKLPKRKTKQQRARAQRRKEEERAQLALKKQRATRQQLHELRALKQSLHANDEERAQQLAQRRSARQARLDERVGMRKLPKHDDDVQLGEDLAESLRQLKPEGNLLQDRVQALQKRGYLEPARTTAASKPLKHVSRKRKEYEQHSYKRFS